VPTMTRAGWVGRQIDLLQAHATRTLAAERRRVKIFWWTAPPRRGPRAGLLASVTRLWSGRPTEIGTTFVGVYGAPDPVGTPPFLVFRVDPSTLPAASGRAVATLVGDAEPGGALIVELHRQALVPIEPPVEPGEDAPPWSETDAEA
jgi:hypothetical protein